MLELLNEVFGKRRYIFLDEIQNISGWELFANRLQRLDYQLILSGSNSKLLSKELSSHLGGRAFTLEVLPFSFTEFLAAKGMAKVNETDEGIGLIKKYLLEFISIGAYPEVLLNIRDNELIKGYYNELFNTIIFKDIMQRFKIRNSSELVSLAHLILNKFSMRTSLSKISKELGISVHTITRYLSYLDEAYLILTSKKFSHKPREMETSFKKYYCIDTGMINAKKTTLTVDFGRLLENMVAIELRRRGRIFYYYLIDEKYEVDFVIAEGNKITEIIQVVNDENGIPDREVRTGLLACERLKINKLTIITWSKEGTRKEGKTKIEMVPLWKWLLSKHQI